MESLFLSTVGQGRRIYLYAVAEGIPLYFKHSELLQTPGYRLLWRGAPASINEQQAAQWVARCQPTPGLYQNYHQGSPAACTATALESFQSAILQLGVALEYAAGTVPREVLVGEVAV